MSSQQGLRQSDLLARYPHLRDYLTELQRRGFRPPTFAVQLSREMRDLNEVNVLYPIGDPYFVHVYSVPGEKWRRYVVVQPEIEGEAWKALQYVDEALAYRLLKVDEQEVKEDRAKVLERLLSEVVRPDPSLKRGEFRPLRRRGVVVQILAEPRLAEGIRHYVLMEKTAHGAIEPLIRDPYIEDISCTGIGPVFIVHKVFESCVTSIEFRDEKELDEFVVRLSIKCGRPVSFRNPIVDAQLPDGSRVNIVYGSDVSRRGSNFTIRKFSDKPISITQLVKWNVLSAEMAAYLWMLLESNMNVWFCGETASGKTTLLRAAAVFIRPTYKIVSIEDVPEIVVPHENWVSEVTKRSETGVGGVELFDLLKAALRQRPNYIIVGEIRGAEASVAFQAMQCVDDALLHTYRGPVWISELYRAYAHLAELDGDGSALVRLPSGIRVPVTTPGRSEAWVGEVVGLKRMEAGATVRVELPNGLSMRVTPNHRFVVRSNGGEEEVTAAELLELWRSGMRSVKLSLRRPAVLAPRQNLPMPRRYAIPASGGTLSYLIGRLIGGDYLVREDGGYALVSRVRTGSEAGRLEGLLGSITDCELRFRSKSLKGSVKVLARGIPARLVHWAASRGLLVGDGRTFWAVADREARLRWDALAAGLVDALEGWEGKPQGPDPVRRALDLLWSIRELGLGDCAELRVGYGFHGSAELERAAGNLGIRVRRVGGRSFSVSVERGVDWEASGGSLEVLEHFRVPADEWSWAVHDLWRAGINVLSFREGDQVFLQPAQDWVRVSDVSPSGPATVYDLVLEGGSYYMAGTGPVLPVMDTGHGVISTFHAGSVQKLIQRLVSDPINVPKTFIDNLNCVVLQSAVIHPQTGKLERRVLSFNEILGVDSETGGVNYVEVFSWNPVTDMHEFRGEGTSYLLEEKVGRMRGIPRREMRKIYRELYTRAEFIRKLIALGVFEYKDVFNAVARAYSVGVERALEEVEVVARQRAEQRR
ncbi:MAG: ATPase, T2SS/T4P/T4SS family [Aigarchaeota archaeon]|nr:ATPase, T2SS/T4P/T4SS family [Candidatus Calditenuis fumarioli]